MKIPLENRLRKKLHVDIARLQDEIVELLYNISNRLILHGGTAIWRCYNGNRFSEDLDFYLDHIENFESKLKDEIKKHGLVITKFKKTENLIYCKISNGSVEIRVEINFSKKVKYVLGKYERADGSEMNVFVLSPDDLIIEKMGAYLHRRFIRDIYDVFHLLSFVRDKKNISIHLKDFLQHIQPPIDEKNLKILIYSGSIPSYKQIVEALEFWSKSGESE